MNAIQKEANEVDIARHFLTDIGHADAHVVSLSEFAGKNLRNKSPDVVAAIDNRQVGIELTAYSDNDSENRWRSFMTKVSERASEYARDFPQLSGISIGYNPRLTNEPRGRDATLFVKQILDFAKSKLGDSPLTLGERRRFPDYSTPFQQKPFANWTLLEKHVSSVSFSRISIREDYPVSVSLGGFTAPMGTSVQLLISTIGENEEKLRGERCVKLDEYWLLVHATGWPISSRIKPIQPGLDVNDEELRNPELVTTAQDSGFDRVYVWDGIHHGFAELTGR